MATIALKIGGAILNAAAFTGGNYLAKYLSSSDNAPEEMVAERKRHDLALEKFEKDTKEFNEKRQLALDRIRQREIEKKEAMHGLSETDQDIAFYAKIKQKNELNKLKSLVKPKWENYYKPSEEQKDGEILFLSIGSISLGFNFNL